MSLMRSVTGRGAAVALALLTAAGPAPASALPPLSKNDYVVERLLAGRVADRIRTLCPEISPRMVRAYMELRALKKWAVGQGYAAGDIDAFVKDGAAKAVLKARAEAYMAANGASDADGACALGRAEIAKGSLIGNLLYEN
jgi:hypothetical protein